MRSFPLAFWAPSPCSLLAPLGLLFGATSHPELLAATRMLGTPYIPSSCNPFSSHCHLTKSC